MTIKHICICLFLRYRIFMRVAYRTVFYRRVVQGEYKRCCPGWTKQNPRDLACLRRKEIFSFHILRVGGVSKRDFVYIYTHGDARTVATFKNRRDKRNEFIMNMHIPFCKHNPTSSTLLKDFFSIYQFHYTAICRHGCINGGICVGPNECECPPSYTGHQCEKGR